MRVLCVTDFPGFPWLWAHLPPGQDQVEAVWLPAPPDRFRKWGKVCKVS